MTTEYLALVARIRAALILISPDDITPMGRRMLERILDDAVENRTIKKAEP
jgi:hypothetical protein